MNDDYMEHTSGCGRQASLVAYLYDECEPGERESIAAHLAGCAACTEELQGLEETRRMLPAWSPPDAALGFRIAGAETSRVLRPARWWQRPLPAWGQAAAAVLIFAAGVSAGRARDTLVPPGTDAREAVAIETGAPAVAGEPAGVSREDLARLELELRAEVTRIAQAQRAAAADLRAASAVRPAAAVDGLATLVQVEALIAESERRQRNQLILAMGEVVADVEARQARALTPVRQAVEGLGREAELNRGSVNALVNAVSAGGFRLVGGR